MTLDAEGWLIVHGLASKDLLSKLKFWSELVADAAARNELAGFPPELVDVQQLSLGHVYDPLLCAFARKNGNTNCSFFEVEEEIKLLEFLNRGSGKVFRRSPVTNMRRISNSKSLGWDKPLSLHLDAMFHYPHSYSINFWIPLHELSDSSASLAVVPSSVSNIKQIMRFDGVTRHHENGIAHQPFFWMNPEDSALDFLKEHNLSYMVPNVPFGSSLVFSNFTLHGTHLPTPNFGPRTSLELRFDCESS